MVEGALGSRERFDHLAGFFPTAQFVLLPPDWSDPGGGGPDILIVGIAASDTDAACRWMKGLPTHKEVVVILHDADVPATRKLMREGGAADVLPAPASETGLVAALERLLAAPTAASSGAAHSGEVVSVLKAGGGVGATTVAVQVGAMIARHSESTVCLADLDLQYGAAASYLDLPRALTVIDCLSAGASLADTPFATALATHASGLRLLAAPSDIVPLEALTPAQVDSLLTGLRREAALTLLDLPSVWTAWTHHALQRSDRIVIVTRLTVPNIQLARRQLRMLMQQHLDGVPVTLVCNALTSDQVNSVSMKSAIKALGRPFDFVLPEDDRLVTAAINQGVELSAVRRGSKLEKAMAELSQALAVNVLAPAKKSRSW